MSGRLRGVAGALIAMIMLAGATAAMAADGDSNCDSGELCFSDPFNLYWPRDSAEGSHWNYDGETYPGSSTNLDDTASSWKNNGGGSYDSYIYYQGGYGSQLTCMNPGTFLNRSNGYGGNAASSHNWIPTNPSKCH